MKVIKSFSILFKTLTERKKSLVFWVLGLFLYVGLLILIYPQFSQLEGFQQFAEQLPPAFRAVAGEIQDFSTPMGFLNTEFFSITFPLLLSIFTIIFASGTLISEEKSGTIELLLSRSVSRFSIIIQKTLAMVLMTLLIGSSVWISVFIFTRFIDFNINLMNVFLIITSAIFLSIVFGMFALAISSIIPNRSISAGATIVLFIASHFLNTFGVLVESLEGLRKISIHYFYNSENILFNGINYGHLLVLIIISVALSFLSFIFFQRRDLGV